MRGFRSVRRAAGFSRFYGEEGGCRSSGGGAVCAGRRGFRRCEECVMARCRREHSLYGRTAVVTGAARGVGNALAWELARRGAHLALLDHEGEALRRVASSLPTEVHCWSVDITQDEAMARVAGEVRDRLGEASVVVANAGIAEGGPFAESDPMTWRRVIEVNLIGSAITARSFLPDLLATRGYFLQVASLASIGAAPLMSSYCASKAGVESFTQSLRAELAAQWPPDWQRRWNDARRPCTHPPGSVLCRWFAPRCRSSSHTSRAENSRGWRPVPPSKRRVSWALEGELMPTPPAAGRTPRRAPSDGTHLPSPSPWGGAASRLPGVEEHGSPVVTPSVR